MTTRIVLHWKDKILLLVLMIATPIGLLLAWHMGGTSSLDLERNDIIAEDYSVEDFIKKITEAEPWQKKPGWKREAINELSFFRVTKVSETGYYVEQLEDDCVRKTFPQVEKCPVDPNSPFSETVKRDKAGFLYIKVTDEMLSRWNRYITE